MRGAIAIGAIGLTAAALRAIAVLRHGADRAVPADGAASLDEVIAELEALVIDPDTPPGRRPFLEISVAVDGPDPHLQALVLAAIADKAVRLTRIRQVRDADATDLAEGLTGDDLDELLPADVFAAAFAKAHPGADLPGSLASAFEELLVAVHSAETD